METTTPGTETSQSVTTQLALLVPSFDPAKDDLLIYQQKVELLTATWPEGKLIELATRLVLNTTGTAFQKLQLNQSQILVNNKSGIRKIIELLGGAWGQIPLEKKFEAAERAIFRCQQKNDEANDSYLARADVLWQELLSKGTKLEELQAYIILRGSLLSSEDKKRVIIDSDTGGSGKLEINKVQAAVRMLGAGFFHEMTSGKKVNRLKTYDNSTALMMDEEDFDENFHANTETSLDDDEVLEQLVAEGDEDALLVSEFESAAQELLQEDTGLSSAFSAYTEARRKLSEKVRFRGFFPIGKGKGKSSSKSGKGRFGKGLNRDRKPLSQRILRSQCRRCFQFGHWKDECPLKSQDGGSTANASSSSGPSSSFTGIATMDVPDALPLEFLNLQEFGEASLDAIDEAPVVEPVCRESFVCEGVVTLNNQGNFGDNVQRCYNVSEALHCLRHRRLNVNPNVKTETREVSHPESCAEAKAFNVSGDLSSRASFGILDTGATKTVIGSHLIKGLLDSLCPEVRKKIGRCACNITFRFGNLSTLESQHALVIPLGRLKLKIAVVPGKTPFLLSNTLARALKAQIDTDQLMMKSPFLKQGINLHLTPKGLFLIDINQLALQAECRNMATIHETFCRQDHSLEVQKNNAVDSSGQPKSSHVPYHGVCLNVEEGLNQDGGTRVCSESSKSSVCDRNSVSIDTRHVQPAQSLEEPPRAQQRARDGLQPHVDCRAGRISGGLRQHSQGQTVHRDVDKPPELDSVVSRPLFNQYQAQSPKDDCIHHSQDREVRTGRISSASDRSGTCQQRDGDSQDGSQEEAPRIQDRDQTNQDRDRTNGGCLESRGGSNLGGSPDGSDRRDCRDQGRDGSYADSHAAHGECHPDDPPTRECRKCINSEGSVNLSTDWHWLNAGDPDAQDMAYSETFPLFFSNYEKSDRNRFRYLVNQYTKELRECIEQQGPQLKEKRALLFEVFCNPDSQLAKQCQNLGAHAERFGYQQGDLHTISGRSNLFNKLVIQRPRHLWYSPMCGPWCAFSALNGSRSEEAFRELQEHRHHHVADIALGVVLLRFQASQNNHFHWEQPSRSALFRSPLMKEVFEKTQCAQFDMCAIGHLWDPQTHKFVKKGMEVLTTSSKLFWDIHGNTCPGNHEHQPIEGTIRIGDQNISRSKWSENYPRKFARRIARLMCHDFRDGPAFTAECFVIPGSRQSKYPKLSGPRAKGNVPSASPAASLPEPKRRRLLEKQNCDKPPEIWNKIVEEMQRITPRVGKRVIDDQRIIRSLQEYFPDKVIRFAVVCRGTDRALGPVRTVVNGEVPFRKCLFLHRETNEWMVEDEWEKWDQLSQAQIQRKGHPCKLNITLFACNPSLEISSHLPAPESRIDLEAGAEPTCRDVSNDRSSSESDPMLSEQNRTDLISHDHGAKFLSLPSVDRREIVKAHKNLGHPSNDKLCTLLKQQGARSAVLEGVHDFHCSVCSSQSPPKHSRPGTIKEVLDFNDRIAIDGLKFTNSQGQQFHLYHIIDLGTNFHVAMIAPNRSAEHAISCFVQMWLCWAGAPCEIVMDSATEFTSDQFSQFLQSYNIRSKTIPPGAHWQNGRCERHGKVLEEILCKVDSEDPITSYDKLQKVLWHATQAKNSRGLRRGFSPEVLVFGKSARLPGSLCGDELLPAHEMADNEHGQGVLFREQLAMREAARRAFHSADNAMSLRRALLRRSCPDRGKYQRGEWVMIWKSNLQSKGWFGPMQVVIQDDKHCIWVTQGGNLHRCAPEHCRPVNAFEAQKLPHGIANQQLQDLETQVVQRQDTPGNDFTTIPEVNPFPLEQNTATLETTPSISNESQDQPDCEPIVPSSSDSQEGVESNQNEVPDGTTIPVPDTSSEDESVCEGWHCVDEVIFNHTDMLAEGLCWRMEVSIDEKDILDWKAAEDPAELSFVVSAAKKQRSEVRLSELNSKEREEFQGAKASEIKNWIKTGTVTRMLRDQLPPEEILRCRWVLTWKPIEPSDRDPNQPEKTTKAKARLVVLGYLDPHLEDLARDSPTLGRHSRMLLLQLIASHGWDLCSFDIKAAFLQGQPQDDRIIGLEPCVELAQAMTLKPNEICRLVKSAYGLIDAPYLWYKALSEALLKLGFETSPFDPCLFLLRNPKTLKPHGVLGIHVDDGLCGGDEVFREKIGLLQKQYPFGSQKTGSFIFTGIQMQQRSDKAIVLSQSEYIRKIKPIGITTDRRGKLEEKVTEEERQALRAIIGSLQYASVNTRPDLASRLSMLQSKINQAQVETLLEANKVLHEAKRHHDVCLVIQPIACEDFRFLAFSDASFSSKTNPDSHAGSIILGTHKLISQNVSCPISPISWGCRKIQKVVTSTLSAETMSLSSMLDQLSWLKLFWGWMLDPKVDWKNPDLSLPKLPAAVSASSIKAQEMQDVAAVDCKSLFDLITRTAAPNCQEYRTQLQARAIKEFLAEGTNLRWVHSGAQLADALTKVMESSFLRETLRVGKYKLHDEREILKQRADKRQRLQWLKADETTESTAITSNH